LTHFDLAQHTVGRHGRLAALPVRYEVVSHLNSNIPLLFGGLQDLAAHGVLMTLVVFANVQNLAFFRVEGHSPYCNPCHQSIQAFLKTHAILLASDHLPNLTLY
jgi:hypothetical protein